jgi:hypothetical protein
MSARLDPSSGGAAAGLTATLAGSPECSHMPHTSSLSDHQNQFLQCFTLLLIARLATPNLAFVRTSVCDWSSLPSDSSGAPGALLAPEVRPSNA